MAPFGARSRDSEPVGDHRRGGRAVDSSANVSGWNLTIDQDVQLALNLPHSLETCSFLHTGSSYAPSLCYIIVALRHGRGR